MIKLEMGAQDGMDLLTFTLEMTKAAAWPLLIGGITIGFRKELRSLLKRKASFDIFGARGQWDGSQEVREAVDEIGEKDAATPAVPQEAPPLPASVGEQPTVGSSAAIALGHASRRFLRRLAREEPRMVMRRSWDRIQNALTYASMSSDSPGGDWATSLFQLQHQRRLSRETMDMIVEAYTAAAPILDGDADVTAAAAKAFVETANLIVERIRVETQYPTDAPCV